MPNRTVMALLAVVALIVIATTALAATGSTVPDWFKDLAIFLAGGGAGATRPGTAAE